MYRYEHDPQDVNVGYVYQVALLALFLMVTQVLLKGVVGVIWMSMTTVLRDICDGLITVSPEAYEPEGTAQVQKWMRGTNRDAWCLGPLLPAQKNDEGLKAETKLSENALEIEHFMDKILKERGENSLLYVGPCAACHTAMLLMASSLDFIRFYLLAVHKTRGGVGFPRRRHGKEYTLCEHPAYCRILCRID